MNGPQVFVLVVICASWSVHSVQSQVFNPLDYGAKGDGVSYDTKAVRAALAAAAENHGGEVLFDKQFTFLTGTYLYS